MPWAIEQFDLREHDIVLSMSHVVAKGVMTRADQFRPGPPPLVGSEELKKEVDECIASNGHLTHEEKTIVEFMRDGPRSTGQSGHWLRFAADVSRRDHYGLDQDVKLFFAVRHLDELYRAVCPALNPLIVAM